MREMDTPTPPQSQNDDHDSSQGNSVEFKCCDDNSTAGSKQIKRRYFEPASGTSHSSFIKVGQLHLLVTTEDKYYLKTIKDEEKMIHEMFKRSIHYIVRDKPKGKDQSQEPMVRSGCSATSSGYVCSRSSSSTIIPVSDAGTVHFAASLAMMEHIYATKPQNFEEFFHRTCPRNLLQAVTDAATYYGIFFDGCREDKGGKWLLYLFAVVSVVYLTRAGRNRYWVDSDLEPYFVPLFASYDKVGMSKRHANEFFVLTTAANWMVHFLSCKMISDAVSKTRQFQLLEMLIERRKLVSGGDATPHYCRLLIMYYSIYQYFFIKPPQGTRQVQKSNSRLRESKRLDMSTIPKIPDEIMRSMKNPLDDSAPGDLIADLGDYEPLDIYAAKPKRSLSTSAASSASASSLLNSNYNNNSNGSSSLEMSDSPLSKISRTRSLSSAGSSSLNSLSGVSFPSLSSSSSVKSSTGSHAGSLITVNGVESQGIIAAAEAARAEEADSEAAMSLLRVMYAAAADFAISDAAEAEAKEKMDVCSHSDSNVSSAAGDASYHSNTSLDSDVTVDGAVVKTAERAETPAISTSPLPLQQQSLSVSVPAPVSHLTAAVHVSANAPLVHVNNSSDCVSMNSDSGDAVSLVPNSQQNDCYSSCSEDDVPVDCITTVVKNETHAKPQAQVPSLAPSNDPLQSGVEIEAQQPEWHTHAHALMQVQMQTPCFKCHVPVISSNLTICHDCWQTHCSAHLNVQGKTRRCDVCVEKRNQVNKVKRQKTAAQAKESITTPAPVTSRLNKEKGIDSSTLLNQLTPFDYFVQARLAALGKIGSQGSASVDYLSNPIELESTLGQQWKEMDVQARQVYIDECNNDMERRSDPSIVIATTRSVDEVANNSSNTNMNSNKNNEGNSNSSSCSSSSSDAAPRRIVSQSDDHCSDNTSCIDNVTGVCLSPATMLNSVALGAAVAAESDKATALAASALLMVPSSLPTPVLTPTLIQRTEEQMPPTVTTPVTTNTVSIASAASKSRATLEEELICYVSKCSELTAQNEALMTENTALKSKIEALRFALQNN